MFDLEKAILKLNPSQSEAVKHDQGPAVVFAGAGSGKTRVITTRILYLISKGVPAHGIMAVTFTNKAAKEMHERIQEMSRDHSNYLSRSISISTFHSACVRILRTFANKIGYQNDFSIADDSDVKSVLKDILESLNIKNSSSLTPQILKSRIDYFKNEGFLVNQKSHLDFEVVKDKIFERFGETQDFQLILEIYGLYQKYLQKNNLMDFNDLILNTVLLLKTDSEAKRLLQNRFRYFLVDEFQDTNPSQFDFISILSDHTNNLYIVGDDDQSIYSWRGARPHYLINFEKLKRNATVYKLEQNYRSTRNIIEASAHLIANNSVRADKNIWTSNEPGKSIEVLILPDAYTEAREIVEKVKTIRNQSSGINDIAVLYRTNAQSRSLEDAFRKALIPYVIYGSVRFYERAEVKILISYLKVVANPSDDLAFEKALKFPKRGLGDKTLSEIKRLATENGLSLSQTICKCARGEIQNPRLSSKAMSALRQVDQLFSQILSKLQVGTPLGEVLGYLIQAIGFENYLMTQYPEDFDERILNSLELRNALSEFEVSDAADEDDGIILSDAIEVGKRSKSKRDILARFLDQTQLTVEPVRYQADERSKNVVTLMTIHSSKGLEFDSVFVCGLEEGTLPHFNSLADQGSVEEERRLLYVAMTRARQDLTLTGIDTHRFRPGFPAEPSRFLFEIPDKLKNNKTFTFSSNRRPPRLESLPRPFSAQLQPQGSQTTIPFFLGEKVAHKVFGEGIVQSVEKSKNGYKVDVLFPLLGVKKLSDAFIQKAK